MPMTTRSTEDHSSVDSDSEQRTQDHGSEGAAAVDAPGPSSVDSNIAGPAPVPSLELEALLHRLRSEALGIGHAKDTPAYQQYLQSRLREEREQKRKKEELEKRLSMEERMQERLHHFELEKLRLQSTSLTPKEPSGFPGRLLQQQAPYDPAKEPLDRYLSQYSSYCALAGISEEDKAVGITTLLPSNLRTALDHLSPEDRKDFDSVRRTLLRAGAYTQEACRRRYLEAVPDPQDTHRSFYQRKLQLQADWFQAAAVTDAQLRDFLVIDDFLHQMPPSYGAYVREGDSYNMEEVARRGDRYLDLHHAGKPVWALQQHHFARIGSNLCVKCHNYNTVKSQRQNNATKKKQTSQDDQSKGATSNASPNTAPKHTQQEKKYSKHPPWKKKGLGAICASPTAASPADSQQPQEAARHASPPEAEAITVSNNSSIEGTAPSRNSQSEESSGTPFDSPAKLSAMSRDNGTLLQTCEGELNGHAVTILLDSGAEGIFVDRRLIPESQLTGETVQVQWPEGDPVTRPLARVNIHCPYYTGTYLAVALNNPAQAVYLGQIYGSKPFPGTAAAKVLESSLLEMLPPPPASIDVLGSDVDALCTPDVQAQGQTSKSGDTVPPQGGELGTASSPLTSAAVQTRSGSRGPDKETLQAPLPPEFEPQDPLLSRAQFAEDQKACPTLSSWHQLAQEGQEKVQRKGACITKFLYKRELLYQQTTMRGQETSRLCIPECHKRQVLYIAHHNPLAGHRGLSRTLAHIERSFVWPFMRGDVERYVHSCHICQITAPRGTAKAPMGITKLSEQPFARVAVDILGPINPSSASGKKFILTYVDLASRYSDAIALRSIDSESVAHALFEICSRVGFPEVLTSDNGTNFTSKTFEAFLSLLRVRHIRTSVYHAQSNGVCERYNGTLKRCLRRLAADDPRHWDRCLPALLFSYRDTPHSSTGYSPFELIYGHQVRGPLEFLKECWESEAVDEEDRDVHKYILQMRRRLKDSCRLALESIKQTQIRNKEVFDRHAKRRLLRPGDQVLVLLPTDVRKLLLQWKGPYVIVKRHDADHYSLSVNGTERRYHINQLKLYHPPGEHHADPALALAAGRATGDPPDPTSTSPESGTEQTSLTLSAQRVLHYGSPEIPWDPPLQESEDTDHLFRVGPEVLLGSALVLEEEETPVDEKDPAIPTNAEETYRDCDLSQELSLAQHDDLMTLLASYKDVLTDRPGLTSAIEHRIRLVHDVPVRKSYPLPHALSRQLQEDLEKWQKMGIIERSHSPYCSPLLAVRKKDGTHRFCLDCRQINQITIFDGEPIADPQHIFTELSSAKFLSKIDLASGFWQVPLSEESRPYTAFSTRQGLFQFRVLPFGLSNAPGCFSRLMRIVLKDLPQVSCYLDDILIHSKDWTSHLTTIAKVLDRLRRYGLHAKPTKCLFGYHSLTYLGHQVGCGIYAPLESKVQAIASLPVPENVTQLRSFLGSTGYYQQFIRGYADIATPLFDLLKSKKEKTDSLNWTHLATQAFHELRQALVQQPVLQLIDPAFPFTVRTDASNVGLGAVLMQPHKQDPRKLAPVMYASRRLKAAENNYATVEKEALSIYWAFHKFEAYIYGREFTLMTDHRPLLYLGSADKLNPRLKRWAIYLGLFKYHSTHIAGGQNHLADLLSRSPASEADL